MLFVSVLIKGADPPLRAIADTLEDIQSQIKQGKTDIQLSACKWAVLLRITDIAIWVMRESIRIPYSHGSRLIKDFSWLTDNIGKPKRLHYIWIGEDGKEAMRLKFPEYSLRETGPSKLAQLYRSMTWRHTAG